MAQSRPSRKRRIPRTKPERYNLRKRVVRRRIERKRKRSYYKERKARLYVIGIMLIAFAIIILLFEAARQHEAAEYK